MGAVEWIGVALILVCAILIVKKFIQAKNDGCGCGCSGGGKKKARRAKVK